MNRAVVGQGSICVLAGLSWILLSGFALLFEIMYVAKLGPRTVLERLGATEIAKFVFGGFAGTTPEILLPASCASIFVAFLIQREQLENWKLVLVAATLIGVLASLLASSEITHTLWVMHRIYGFVAFFSATLATWLLVWFVAKTFRAVQPIQ